MRLDSRSLAETLSIGRRIGRALKKGDVVALMGQLGSGKTTLAKGIAAGLEVAGAEESVTSPTFALVHEYQGREKVYHMDWYRLEGLRGPDRELAEECFESGAVSLVEWAERGPETLPDDRIEIRITAARASGTARRIEIAAPGGGHEELLSRLAKAAA